MKIPESPDDAQKRAKGQLAGSRGKGFLELTNFVCKPEHRDLFKKVFEGESSVKDTLKPKKKRGTKKKK